MERETQDRLASLILERLTEEFPQHEFIAGRQIIQNLNTQFSPPMTKLDPRNCPRRVRLEVR
jgi:hypothetical protein